MIRPMLKKTKIFITGGFRTAGGMVRAVESGACDGVGIGRPLGAEPFLCREILEGRVTGGKSSNVVAAVVGIDANRNARSSNSHRELRVSLTAVPNYNTPRSYTDKAFSPLPQNTQATGTQLHQIGHGHSLISDWSSRDEVDRWVDAFEQETKRKEALLPKVDSSGYPFTRAEVGFQYVR